MNTSPRLSLARRLDDTLAGLINKNARILFLLLVTGMALFARWRFFPFVSGDFAGPLSSWLATLRAEGLSASGGSYTNYSLPYIYILYFMSWFDIPAQYAIKIPSVIADVIMAVYGAKIIMHLTGSRLKADLCFALLMFCPTVIYNSGLWGQCDSVFTAPIIASLYYLFKGQYKKSMLLYGLAFCIKLQAVFILPFYLALALNRVYPIYYLFTGPLLYVLLHLPALTFGADLRYVFWQSYLKQPAHFRHIVMNAPTMWVYFPWLDVIYHRTLILMGFGFAAAGSYAAYITGVVRRNAFTACTFFAIFVPFVLPRMHERYFFIGDVLSVMYAFYKPSRFFIPCLVVGASFLAYCPFLFDVTVIPFTTTALMMGAACAFLGLDLWRSGDKTSEETLPVETQ